MWISSACGEHVDILARPSDKTLPCAAGWLNFEVETRRCALVGQSAHFLPAGTVSLGLNVTSSPAGMSEHGTWNTAYVCANSLPCPVLQEGGGDALG